MDSPDLVFFTLLAAPTGNGGEELRELLSRELGIDIPTLRLRLRRGPPVILGRVERRRAEAATAALRRRGGTAFSPSLADLAALGPTIKIRELARDGDAFAITPWRGPEERVPFGQIEILVRASLSETKTKPEAPLGITRTARHLMDPGYAAAWAFGGAYGLAAAFALGYATVDRPERTTRTSEKLDLHTADGRVFQVDGDKFGFTILGAERGHTDRANIDKLCSMVTLLAPHVVVDPYYSLWKPPPGHRSLRVPDMRINEEDVAFCFYSRWAALLYRELMATIMPRHG